MRRIHRGYLYYRSNGDARGERTAKCYVQIFVPTDTERGILPVVIATELPDNHGTSITNAFERVASQVFREWPILRTASKEGVLWVEHYAPDYQFPNRPYVQERLARLEAGEKLSWHPGDPSWSKVEFSLTDPKKTDMFDWHDHSAIVAQHPNWRRTFRKEIEQLVGCALSETPHLEEA